MTQLLQSMLNQEPIYQIGAFALYYGRRFPLGATLDAQGCNFAVFAGSAKNVELCLFDEYENELARFVLPCQYGAFHYGYIRGIKAGQLYGYRVYGEFHPEFGQVVLPNKLLIDPYAKAINRPQVWNPQLYENEDGSMIAKSVVIDDQFDWQGVTKPDIPIRQSILYELHLKGYTKCHPSVPKALQGTYLGLCEPNVIRYLKSLGITTIQIMPIAAFMDESHLRHKGLTNYWGYNPIAFFAPEPRYSVDNAVKEFKTMVRELHRNGLEVILDVVFNHTAEGGKGGPIISFRGLGNYCYYLFEQNGLQPDYELYANYSGCGNSVDISQPIVLHLVTDCLRYWADVMQVDGFRFDLAVSVGRERASFSPLNAFFKTLEQDPVLSQVKLIAEPWDIGPDGYQVGHFPYNWHECNDHYRDNIRAYWRGDEGQLGEFATRLMGSRDLFVAAFRSIHSSVNFICYHDGFTLQDLVSFEQRHNEANKEHNRDGHGHNLSANYGFEGLTQNHDINVLRNRQKRNFIATLFISQGIPHFLAGDEFGRTQRGNNNAYCQDNDISWVDWNNCERNRDLVRFTQTMVHLRQRFELLSHLRLGDDSFPGDKTGMGDHGVRWYRPDGQLMTPRDWNNGLAKAIMVEYYCRYGCDEHLLVLFNASNKPLRFYLPDPGGQKGWYRWVDTQYEQASDSEKMLSGKNTILIEHSMQLFEKQSIGYIRPR